jgi:hypothetical protein
MDMSTFVQHITEFHAQAIIQWKADGVHLTQQGPMAHVECNHSFNFQLWHAEDRARRQDMGDAFVVKAKREIDHCNQQRNNAMEKIDQDLIQLLHPASHEACKVHSETPGMMIDRLSILSLKIYHMKEQTLRQDVEEAHLTNCLQKYQQLQTQHQQLSNCLKDLLEEVKHQTRTFRVYHQHKMYNDPSLNPELYQKTHA